MASNLYYDGTELYSTTATPPPVSWTTTTDGENKIWGDGNYIYVDESPNHYDLSGLDGSWSIQQPPTDHGIWVDGEQVMKFNDDVHVKIDGDWVSVKDLNLRIKTLEVITEKLYNLLPVWQRNILNMDEIELEDKKEEFEHFDPDLFKV